MKFYLTGDTHGDFKRIAEFCDKHNTTKDDVMCILGDAGINYYLGKKDYLLKEFLKDLPITLFCIHGNHEARPQHIPSYDEKEWNNGIVYYEEDYPNILFARHGEIFNINGKSILVIGGAYSVDKEYRLMNNYMWFEDEQPNDEIKQYVKEQIKKQEHFDIVLSHTCPIMTQPTHMFLGWVNQFKVDKSTEIFLQDIADKIDFDNWYFGHFHGAWDNGKYHMLFENYVEVI
jgi:3-oxoacid CoA-transferase subunit A